MRWKSCHAGTLAPQASCYAMLMYAYAAYPMSLCIFTMPQSSCVAPINVPYQGQCTHTSYPEHIHDDVVPRRQIEALRSVEHWVQVGPCNKLARDKKFVEPHPKPERLLRREATTQTLYPIQQVQ
ncbi:hypothetical protein HAX54_001441 [Datura stramonium]|uniref:Uncharacterized protein n=1 Tax=Datura stramonium TaxID=4076 RepID=A0ABS8WQQ7_DATST|nr:hypothetical protein [Datura stramonium]